MHIIRNLYRSAQIPRIEFRKDVKIDLINDSPDGDGKMSSRT